MRILAVGCSLALAFAMSGTASAQDESSSTGKTATVATHSGDDTAAVTPRPVAENAKKEGKEASRTPEEVREQILLDRIDQLEKRLADLETKSKAEVAAPAEQAATPAAAPAQQPTPAPAPAPDAAPAASPTWSVGPIDFSGLVDGYYSYNANHPDSGFNQLYNFDVKANTFSLNMAKLSMSHTADPVGFQVDLGFGRAFDIIHAGEPSTAPSFLRNVEQAYVSLKPTQLKGMEIDLGQFVTSAGAEVIESNGNWNYSRSLLFAWAIPYYHFGLRTTIPVGKHFTGGFQLVNGWNNTEDNNSGKTIGLTSAVSYSKFTWSTNYYAGPENTASTFFETTNKGWRHLFDTTLLLTPNSIFNAYINVDYGQNRTVPEFDPAFTSKWYGVAGAVKIAPNSKWAFTPRVEWFKDRDGFSTGTAQDLKEFTMTGEYKMVEGFLTRLEYRHDWSNVPFFDHGLDFGTKKSQDTLALAFIAYFGPKR